MGDVLTQRMKMRAIEYNLEKIWKELRKMEEMFLSCLTHSNQEHWSKVLAKTPLNAQISKFCDLLSLYGLDLMMP